jgi:hypothetical protein
MFPNSQKASQTPSTLVLTSKVPPNATPLCSSCRKPSHPPHPLGKTMVPVTFVPDEHVWMPPASASFRKTLAREDSRIVVSCREGCCPEQQVVFHLWFGCDSLSKSRVCATIYIESRLCPAPIFSRQFYNDRRTCVHGVLHETTRGTLQVSRRN